MAGKASIKNTVPDKSTEDKIKAAARKVFHEKGFAATRTRDIADAAGINHALLNYYFRSKEKLFEIIMLETMIQFFGSLSMAFNNPNTTLEEKIEHLASNYIDLLTTHPDIPLFIMSEMKSGAADLITKVGSKDIVLKSAFMKQFQQAVKEDKIMKIHPMHFLMNLMGLTVFPFVASPMIMGIADLTEKDFLNLMQERKKLIPVWVKTMLQPK
jgi:AcrR family transcriptional regulator